jgi:hypothetical protein
VLEGGIVALHETYERKIVKIEDSEELQIQLLGHQGFRLAAAIPWGDAIFLVFEGKVADQR